MVLFQGRAMNGEFSTMPSYGEFFCQDSKQLVLQKVPS